ncbi:MAG: hypothetical protein K8T89_07150 [Planctomycetes bacterium]|nr:hypothetical protein [Planctomycetota bacterium]
MRIIGQIKLMERIQEDINRPLDRGMLELLAKFLFKRTDVGRQFVGEREFLAQHLAEIGKQRTEVGGSLAAAAIVGVPACRRRPDI